ncbi:MULTISPECIES: helix-turn-helix domain-containing protein [Pasteurellaceae]|uniref:AraC family transcriptional regulator n=1 Tax=Pasteurella atlantica TaxID=2827233 RepID=A0AAW8CRW1_9PAST|nr:AraC family transcriptional regulator [Pasteurella atlantica]MBR0573307.1 helix-turn-helix transcriptional regulator [Pasteurella atlantica]MDP8040141.1 AraC family transcriptional regulator [Pasteurella atlantica]MDP8042254.1 AraC family transcriptional regulator [Pasteurella atlantica]MDP8044439.1 AraC family transcriptional regulator [Pasteurella atlantica]MDP8046451.1 AraC family transcriptional regulator [Pasteurella atlantica]
MIKYKELKPTGFLQNFIECFWDYKTDKAIQHTILPDGYFDLIAEFEDNLLTKVKLTGIWTTPKHIDIPKNKTFIAIRFKILAAEYIFQREIKSILDTEHTLPFHFWNLNSFQHNEFERFVSHTTHHIENVITQIKNIDNRKLTLFDLIYQQNVKTVTELSEQVFWSSRQINRYFSKQFGFSLKNFLKIIRFKSSYKQISAGKLTPNNGYSDQSHFIKEVKQYAGVTPKELYKNENDRFLQLSTLNK